MNIKLFDGPIDTSSAMLDRVSRRVVQALRRVADRIGEVQVRLSDLNGGKGGVDKRCRIVAQVAHNTPIVVDYQDTDYYRAIDGAAARLRHAAERRLRRRD